MTEFDRIPQDPDVMAGKPCIRGTRVTVGMIINQIDVGRSSTEVLTDFPYLERKGIEQAMRYDATTRKGRA